jgi:hypothetical protein
LIDDLVSLLIGSLPTLVLLVGFSFVLAFFYEQLRRMLKRYLRERYRDQRRVGYFAEVSGLAKAVDEKKQEFLNIPSVSFHYSDKDRIKSLYNQYFKEGTVEQVISEMASGRKGELKGKLPQVLEATIGGEKSSKLISTLKLPDMSIEEMFLRYQQETIKNDQVTLGLEMVDIDLTDLNDFDKLLSDFKSKFQMELDQALITKQRTLLKKKAAERTLVRLEKASGSVLIEGKFRITAMNDEFYKCTYEHPVDEYLGEEAKRATMSVTLRKKSLEESIAGNYAQSIGMSIPFKVYGTVWQPLDRKADVWELQVTPLAVYQ